MTYANGKLKEGIFENNKLVKPQNVDLLTKQALKSINQKVKLHSNLKYLSIKDKLSKRKEERNPRLIYRNYT